MGELFGRTKPAQCLEWTGERLTTGATGQVETEHLHRYLLARHLTRGLDVLDIASGEGYGSAFIAQTARSVTGVEIDPVAVEHARNAYVAQNLRFLEGSAQLIPMEDQSVDCVVSFETIEHFYNQEQFLSEIRRVLRPGGSLIISAPNRDIYSPPGAPSNPYHVRELTRSEFAKLLRAYFADVVLLGQRAIVGSVIFPETVDDRRSGCVTFAHLDSDRFEASPGLDRPVYCVAIASDSPFSSPAASFYFEHGSVDDILVTLPALRLEHQQACARAASLAIENQEKHARLTSLEAEMETERARTNSLEAEVEKERTRANSLEAEIEKERTRANSLETAINEERTRVNSLEAENHSIRIELQEWIDRRINWSNYNVAYYVWKEYKKKRIDRDEALRLMDRRFGVRLFFFLFPLYKAVKPLVKCKRWLLRSGGRESRDRLRDPDENSTAPDKGKVDPGGHDPGDLLQHKRPEVVRRLTNSANLNPGDKPQVLVLGVYLANRANNIEHVVDILSHSRLYSISQQWIALQGPASSHALQKVTVQENALPTPKYVLLNALLNSVDLDRFEYVLTVDDDIVLPEDFVDEFLYIQTKLKFSIAQPARTHNSQIDHPIVREQRGLMARQTRFVEIGPVVSFHRSAFSFVFPFDLSSPMGFGYEQVWSCEVHRRQMKMGIIDNTPVDHSMRARSAYYDPDEECRRGEAFLSSRDHFTFDECDHVLKAYNPGEIE